MKGFQKDYYLDESDAARRERKKREGLISGLVITGLGLLITLLAFIILFHTKEIKVTGNEYCTKNEIINWLHKDKLTANSLYTWLRYNYLDVEQLPLVEESEITLENPWTIQVRVYEKSIVGYLVNTGQYIYFDKDGMVIQISDKEPNPGIPKIEGIEVALSSVKAHQQLPVEDKEIFTTIREVTREVENCELKPDRMLFEKDMVTLGFGHVDVLLGQGNMNEKIAQIAPILEKLEQRYAEEGPCGTLHLENYSNSSKTISYIPEDIDNSENSEDDSDGDGYVSPFGNEGE